MTAPASILVVDDNPILLEMMARQLAAGGYAVTTASTGAQALQAVEQHPPRLVLLDMILPDMPGLELCARLKSLPASSRPMVVLISSILTDSNAQAEGMEAGADGYITRPIPGRELLARAGVLLRLKDAEDALLASNRALEGRIAERTAQLEEANRDLEREIARRKECEAALELRVRALTRPPGPSADLRFDDLFDVAEIQRVQDAFAAATGVASIITDTQGRPITRPSQFCALCELIRQTPAGLKNCYCSDALLGRLHPNGPIMQPCLSAGLWDGGASIQAGDHHIANWLVGQVLDEEKDPAVIPDYARSIGADPAACAEALKSVKRMSRAQFASVCAALFHIAGLLSRLALQNLLQARHITERRAIEDSLRASLEEKTALLKEVHHRVKNNLQIVTSLLSLQAGRLSNPAALGLIQDARNRVLSMAMLHETLYGSDNLASLDMPGYVQSLCAHLFRCHSSETAARVRLEQRVGPVRLGLDQAVPCGLILNELISNALKHAFPDGRSGAIAVALNPLPGGRARLSVQDDGAGLPPGLNPLQTPSLGLKLVQSLAAQLDGTLQIAPAPGGGCAFDLTFPLPAPARTP